MKYIRESSWNEVLRKMITWGNHPKSNERRYIPSGSISKSKFLHIRSTTLYKLPVEQLKWTLAEIQDDDIGLISYMNCVEWASIRVLETARSSKIKEIQTGRSRRELGVLVRSSERGWHIILDGCHRISAAHLKGNLAGKKVFVGEGNVRDWVHRWMWR